MLKKKDWICENIVEKEDFSVKTMPIMILRVVDLDTTIPKECNANGCKGMKGLKDNENNISSDV